MTVTVIHRIELGDGLKNLLDRLAGGNNDSEVLERIERRIEKMANDLSAELSGLSDAVAQLGAAVDKEIQQVIDAVNAGAAGQEAIAALESARGNITSVTASIQAQVARLGADDPAAQATEAAG